jgi:uncharacterized protein YacL
MGIKEWVQNIILKKALRSGVGIVVAFLCSGMIAAELQKLGITINKGEMELALMALIAGGIEGLRAWLKNKYGLKFL